MPQKFMNRRLIIIVLDSVGIGAAPDAAKYGDSGAHTLGHISEACRPLHLPNLEKAGLGHIAGVKNIQKTDAPTACYARLLPRSAGKDTTTGHWEIAGMQLQEPFPTYPDGFPGDLVAAFEKLIGRKTLGNKAASGTEIINELGEQHVQTGSPIIYTSADSVFQIAAHEAVIPPDVLYEMCQKARKLLKPPHAVARVIARPFAGQAGNWQRTARRKDYSLTPDGTTLLDLVFNAGLEVRGVGKISDIFAGRSITSNIKTNDNLAGIKETIRQLKASFSGLLFTNLVDFDMLYGHRNDVSGYARALQEFDSWLPQITECLKSGDLLMITADHGCDPTFPGTDHTREAAPLLATGIQFKKGVDMGTRNSFSDIAATGTQWLGLPQTTCGSSFLKDIT